MEYVFGRYLPKGDMDRAMRLLQKLRDEGNGAGDAQGPEVLDSGAEVGASKPEQGGRPKFTAKDAFLLNIMYGHCRDQHIADLSIKFGRSLRSIIRRNLNLRQQGEVLQNLSAEGGLADSGDLRKEMPMTDIMAAVASNVNTTDDYIQANSLMMSLGGSNPNQEVVFDLWLTSLFQTVEKVGVDPITYINSKDFNNFMLNFLGGHEAGYAYGKMVEGIRGDFRLRPPADVHEAAQRLSKQLGNLLRAYDEQEQCRSAGLAHDLLQSSPFAQRLITVNSAKGKTPAGMECFKAADGTMMVTPREFAFEMMREVEAVESTLSYSYNYRDAEYSGAMRRHQQALTQMLDEVVNPLTDKKSNVELVGWEENYAFRHVGASFHGLIDWESQKPYPKGEDILYLEQPSEEGRPFVVSKRMMDIMNADDAEGQNLGLDRNERRFAAEILLDLRRTIAGSDWTSMDDDAQERVFYAASKARHIIGLFESIHQPDAHVGQTDYMFSRMNKLPKPDRVEIRMGRYRFDWLDEAEGQTH